ncbi:MAG TPA: hypothetical protein VKU82_05385, partial [Planctomycetaceae bacterium]|nr:hypothetical protein [Planctomycetaceae bacterium]
SGNVRLNGNILGDFSGQIVAARFGVTGLLGPSNVLEIEFEFTDFSLGAPPGGLLSPVVLEISAHR